MGGGRGAHGGGAAVDVHLVVDQSPLLQEGMHPEHSIVTRMMLIMIYMMMMIKAGMIMM